jgi:hypothetical protein
MKKALLLFALAACGSKSPKVANEGGGSGTAAPVAETFTLDSLEQGDVSCYLDVTDGKGQQVVQPAVFELCPGAEKDASQYVGKKITLTWGKANVLGDSCDGNPDCKDTKNIDIVEDVSPAE